MNLIKTRSVFTGLLVSLFLTVLYILYSLYGIDTVEVSSKKNREIIRKKQTLFQVALYPVKIAPLVSKKGIKIYTDFNLFTFQPAGREVKNPFDFSSNYVIIKQYNDSTELTTVEFDVIFRGIEITDIVFKKENDFHVYKYNFWDRDFPVNAIYCYVNANNMFYLGFKDIPVYVHDSLVKTPKKVLDGLEPAKKLLNICTLVKKSDSVYIYKDYYGVYREPAPVDKIYEKEIIDLLKKGVNMESYLRNRSSYAKIKQFNLLSSEMIEQETIFRKYYKKDSLNNPIERKEDNRYYSKKHGKHIVLSHFWQIFPHVFYSFPTKKL